MPKGPGPFNGAKRTFDAALGGNSSLSNHLASCDSQLEKRPCTPEVRLPVVFEARTNEAGWSKNPTPSWLGGSFEKDGGAFPPECTLFDDPIDNVLGYPPSSEPCLSVDSMDVDEVANQFQYQNAWSLTPDESTLPVLLKEGSRLGDQDFNDISSRFKIEPSGSMQTHQFQQQDDLGNSAAIRDDFLQPEFDTCFGVVRTVITLWRGVSFLRSIDTYSDFETSSR